MLQLFIVVLAAAAMADVTHDGPCPDIKPVQNFNLTAYQGLWYEIQKFPTQAEKGGNCGQAEYKLEGDVVKVKNSHVIDGTQAIIEGTAKFADDAKNAAKLVVSLAFGDKTRESPLSVVATDYENYGIAYNCKYDDKKKTHSESIWILARSKKLEGEAKTAVDNFLKEHKEIDVSKLVLTDFSEEACKFSGTTVITEPNSPKKQ